MVGVICDQEIFLEILGIVKPKITKKFYEVGLDGSVLSIQWFVCLFTSLIPLHVNIGIYYSYQKLYGIDF
jgi:hypothetical protein